MKLASLILLCAVVTSSCGGGNDDESGSPTALSLVPNSITLTGPAPGVCGAGTVGLVVVSGGVAPYRVINTVPAYISVDKTEVAHRNESFTVTFLGGCIDPGNVVVIDSLDHQVVLTVTNQEGEAATP